MEIHDDDIPGQQTPLQRFEFRKSLVLGVIVIVLGGTLAIIGVAHHRSPVIPIVAFAAGALLIVFDLATQRSRRRKLGR